VVKQTYENALRRGENAAFIDGHTLFGNRDKDTCTVDGCHPTDLGFYKMAQRVYKALQTFPEFKKGAK
jgi:hypothetical protein